MEYGEEGDDTELEIEFILTKVQHAAVGGGPLWAGKYRFSRCLISG
jgi:hypothetical protein